MAGIRDRKINGIKIVNSRGVQTADVRANERVFNLKSHLARRYCALHAARRRRKY